MKKILFVLAMLLMSMTSALAEELEETFTFVGKVQWEVENFLLENDHFSVSGDLVDIDGAYINDKSITISAKNGEVITRVLFYISWGEGAVDATAGTVRYVTQSAGKDVYEIYDVNNQSLNISSDSEKDFQIGEITVYYELGNSENNNEGNNGGGNVNNNTFVMDEYVQTESFSINGEPTYSGRKITIEGTGNGDGYQIADGKSVTITGNSNVKIVKVDFGLSVCNNDSPINSIPGVVEGSDKSWTINNINSSSLKISNPGEGKVQINSIKVYYVELSTKEKMEFFDVATVNSCSGKSVTIKGTENRNHDMELANRNSVTITANAGVEITMLDVHFEWYLYPNDDYKYYKPIKSTDGVVEMYGDVGDESCYIKNVNSSNLTLSHPGDENYEVHIGDITVYYKEKVPPTTIDVAAKFAGDGYWATFYSNACNYIAPKGTRLFKVHLDDDASITMTEIQDSVVAKGQGVVLKSTTGNISMSKTTLDSSGDYSRNSLMGTSVSIINPGNAYVLSSSSKYGVGFYKLSSNGTIGINRAYLVYNGSTEARSFFAFDDVTTGIEMNNVDNNKSNDKVYDLQGRRVTKPTNGIYIVNGKKVIMNRR